MKILQTFLFTFAFCLLPFALFPQVSVNTTGADPDNSAMLDVTSTSKGMLVPRMTAADRIAINAPATGLMIFQTDATAGFWYFDGANWKRLDTGSISGVTGTAPIVSSGSAAPVISISAATISTAGSMSAADKTKLDCFSTGTTAGQMQYWNGTAWTTVASGQNGQILKYKNGVPTWVDDNIDNLSIGDYYKGGIIGYFLQPSDPGYDSTVRHGLIAAPSDQGAFPWGCNGTFLGLTSISIGQGVIHTAAIVGSCNEAGIAARICSDLVLNGYDDWFLPSRNELYQISLNRAVIGGFAENDYYWTSSEYDANGAREVRMGYSNWYYWVKPGMDRVRAVRTF